MTVCEHESAEGVDGTPAGPEKVWRCCTCGWVFRSTASGRNVTASFTTSDGWQVGRDADRTVWITTPDHDATTLSADEWDALASWVAR